MVMRVDVIDKALSDLKARNQKSEVKSHSILTSPRGKKYDQNLALQFAQNVKHLVIICGHYEGFDERVSELVDEEISLGDFVMTGGEIAAAAIIDSVTRLLHGAIKEESPDEESFFTVSVESLEKILDATEVQSLKNQNITTVSLLEYPHYTRPEEYKENKVPEVLLSGHHKESEKWRLKKAYELTKKRRPDLLKRY